MADERPPTEEPPAWTSLLQNRSLLLLTASYGAVNYFQYLFFYWILHYLVKVLHVHEQTSQVYAAIPPLAMAVGMPLGGLLSDWLEQASGTSRSRRIVPMAGMTAGAILLIIGVIAREPVWIVAWFAARVGSGRDVRGAVLGNRDRAGRPAGR